MNHRTQYGWMALGGMLCLFGVVLAFKIRDGNRAVAQTDAAHTKLEVMDPTKTPKVLAPVGETGKELPPIGAPMPEAAPSKEIIPVGLPPTPPLASKATLTEAAPPPPLPPAPPATPATSPLPPPPPGTGLAPLGSDPRPILIPASASVPAPPTVPLPAPGSTAPAPPPAPSPEIPKAEVKTPPAAPPPPPMPPASAPSVAPPPPPMVPPPASAPSLTPPPAVAEVSRTPSTPRVETPPAPGEPPLAPTPGPVVNFQVKTEGETFKTLARRTLGSTERWIDIHKLNPSLKPDLIIITGTVVRLPGDACVQEEGEAIKPLPPIRPRLPVKVKSAMPLTGTFQVNLDDKKVMALPKLLREQLGNCDTVLVSPGPDKCLWLTNNSHLDRLTKRLEDSPAREVDVRVFKRLYYAQTVKVSMKDGRVAITERLAQFAGLEQEVVLVGIDDHFEIWDSTRWRRYTQSKKAPTAESE